MILMKKIVGGRMDWMDFQFSKGGVWFQKMGGVVHKKQNHSGKCARKALIIRRKILIKELPGISRYANSLNICCLFC